MFNTVEPFFPYGLNDLGQVRSNPPNLGFPRGHVHGARGPLRIVRPGSAAWRIAGARGGHVVPSFVGTRAPTGSSTRWRLYCSS